MNIAQKVGCYDKSKDLFLPAYEQFKVVSLQDIIEEGHVGFKADEFSESYELKAFLLPIDIYNPAAPSRKFKSHVRGFKEVILNKEVGLQIQQGLELSVDQIGILRARSMKSSDTTKVIAGGLIFSDGQGKVLIYNPVLPKPFGDYELSLNPELSGLLNQLAEESLTAPVCIKDNHVATSPKDCHKIIFDSKPLGLMKQVKILSIDFANQKIQFI